MGGLRCVFHQIDTKNKFGMEHAYLIPVSHKSSEQFSFMKVFYVAIICYANASILLGAVLS